jgi:hypothetical protein
MCVKWNNDIIEKKKTVLLSFNYKRWELIYIIVSVFRRQQIYTRRKRGRLKVRWLDDVQEELQEMGIEGWRRKVQDRDQWRRIAQEAKAHVGL